MGGRAHPLWHTPAEKTKLDNQHAAVREAASAACMPTSDDNLTTAELDKLRVYAERRAAAIASIAPSIRPTLLADQLERVAHWATSGVAAATHALLMRLSECCTRPRAAAAPGAEVDDTCTDSRVSD